MYGGRRRGKGNVRKHHRLAGHPLKRGGPISRVS
jgi:hypothetical protein